MKHYDGVVVLDLYNLIQVSRNVCLVSSYFKHVLPSDICRKVQDPSVRRGVKSLIDIAVHTECMQT